MAGVSDVQETYTGGDTMRCACAIASAYTSADNTGVNADRYGIASRAFASVSGVLLANRVSSAPGSAAIYKRFVCWLRRCRACCGIGPPGLGWWENHVMEPPITMAVKAANNVGVFGNPCQRFFTPKGFRKPLTL